ncbi:small GTPase EhRabD2, putative [Entamoeba histolytica HM-3:IMSS]|uniref:Small GTPase EhRabD2, putative n=2 Tax=Entamoeba histolytica TaxID=5759 RepID=M2S0B6_ENTHI|nr:small GTPase EhRabD2, putative [Entamoeba histolytica KU27]EMS16124.1 small GTPase EhRabD2, putative [Entamoeba histolytica HM-3:IMSS]
MSDTKETVPTNNEEKLDIEPKKDIKEEVKPEEEHKEEEHKEEEHKEEKPEEVKPEEVKPEEEKKNESNEQQKVKVIMVGESSVGKTCCMNRYVSNEFAEQTKATIGVGVGSKEVEVEGKHIKLQIWDTAGQERFATLTGNYFRNAMAAIIMFDVSNKESFENIPNWVEQCCKSDGKHIIFIAGNKIDLENRVVSKEEAEEKAKELKLKYFEVSAKTGDGIEDLFNELIKEIMKTPFCNEQEKEGVELDGQKKQKKGGCC